MLIKCKYKLLLLHIKNCGSASKEATVYCYHCQVYGCINVHVSVYALNKENEVKNEIEQDQVKT